MRYLDLRNKNLTLLPTNIDENVEYLDLSFNSLTTLPDSFEDYKNLKILFLSNNNFCEVPKIISKMKNLFMLSFKNNNILTVDNIPPSVGWLILTNNKINKIVSLGHLLNLRKLMLSGNRLNSLPSDIVKCQKIELLRLSNNLFNSVPQSIFELDNLAWISLAHNPCFPLPKLNNNKLYIERQNVKYIEQLGEGTSGIVYKSIINKEVVAVKEYKGKMTSDGLSTNEIYILSSIEPHLNLSHVIGYLYKEKIENIKGIIMPLFREYSPIGLPPTFDSVTRDLYEKQIINPEYIIEHIETALNHLHNNNIIHGDLYAHNIIYNQNKNHSVLTDFGASFYIDDQDLLKKFIIIEKRALNILKKELNKTV